jgi:hypothetical protein
MPRRRRTKPFLSQRVPAIGGESGSGSRRSMFLLTSLNRSWRYRSCPIDQHSPCRSPSIFAQGGLPTVRVRELRGSVPCLVPIAALILLSTFPPAFADAEGGLDSLAEYERGDGLASWPGKQLRGARANRPETPGLAILLRALNEFPRALPSTINQHLFWKKTEVDGRPTFILAHVLLEERPDSLAFVLREFYIGHSYNILQQIGIALPQGEGSVVFALNSTITDAISGMFSGVARAIGQRRAREALEAYFDGIRRSVGGGSAPDDTRR